MKKTFFFSIMMILVIGLSLSYGQAWRGRGRVSGTVKDAEGKPIEGVVVHFENSKFATSTELKTNGKGEFQMGGIRGGNWGVTFSKQGYKTETIDYTIMEFDYNKPIEQVLVQGGGSSTVSGGTTAAAPKGPDLAEAQAGRDLLAAKDYPGAIAKFNAALEKNPSIYQIYTDIARANYEAGNMDEAIKNYEIFLDKDKAAGNVMPNQDVLLAIAAVYMDKKDMTNAKKYLEGVDESTIKDPTIFYNLGVASTNAGDMNSAIKYFEKSVAVDPTFVDGLYQLAVSYVGKGDNAKAIEYFKKVIAADPNSDNAKDAQDFINQMGGQ